MNITADFNVITGRVKPMHGIGQPPTIGQSTAMFHYLRDAGIPYSRLHDVGGRLGGGVYVDIPNIFRDFDADENDPNSYDFVFTDWLMEQLIRQDCEPFFRLGVTIENAHMMKSYNIYPPKDPHKWARICEHIIRHYNQGWANGYRWGIEYWEIWNEPDDCWKEETSAMWKGTKEQYFELYSITANHLKKCFGSTIRVGGYASCGFYAMDSDPDYDGMGGREAAKFEEFFIQFFREFLLYISSEEHRAPLDFFSWHTYADVKTAIRHAQYCRRVLDNFGFTNTEDILNEWNTTHDRYGRSTLLAAARVLAMMIAMQKQSPSMLCFYDGRLGPSEYGGLFNPDTWEPYPAYYAMKAFNDAYRLGFAGDAVSDNEDVYVMAAADRGVNGGKAVLLIANLSGKDQNVTLDLRGVNMAKAEVIRTDRGHTYTITGEHLWKNQLFLPADGSVEIRF